MRVSIVDVLMAWSRALGGVSSPSRERSAVCHSGLGRDDGGVVICEDGGADPRWQRAGAKPRSPTMVHLHQGKENTTTNQIQIHHVFL